ncbi:MAG: HEAT repeat domain-containing protein [Clostridiales bacterium]|nr:HEAT repeat domain-containing protein [Clostridiales bacterium]
MSMEQDWARIVAHHERLNQEELQGIATVLFREGEGWLEEKLQTREAEALAMEMLGCLGHGGSESAAEVLLRQLESREEALQIAAAEALKMCVPELVIQPLIEMIQRQGYNAIKAGEVVLRFGALGADAIWQLWFREGSPVSLKTQILQLLTEAKDDRVEPLAYLAFVSGEEDLIRAALDGAEKMRLTRLWGNVVLCLASPNWRLRGGAVRILGSWGEERAQPFLVGMGVDPDPWVEEERQAVLRRLG